MDNIFEHKHTHEEVNLIHMGKMDKSNETVAIYEVETDRTIMVMPLILKPSRAQLPSSARLNYST